MCSALPTPSRMHPVAQLIHQRLQGKPDPYKLAIVAEDGGMRWVVTGEMFAYLQAHNFMGDIIGGASAGALSGLFYAGGQTVRGPDAIACTSRRGFYDDPRNRFLNFLHLVKPRRPILDIDQLIDGPFSQHVGLNWPRLVQHPSTIFVTATHPDGTPATLVLNGQPITTAKQYAKATARIPFLSPPCPHLPLWDGALSSALPVREAFDLGADYVLTLRARTPAEDAQTIGLIEQLFMKTCLPPAWRSVFLERYRRRTETLEAYRNSDRVLFLQQPTLKLDCHQDDERSMLAAALAGWQFAGEALQLPPKPFPVAWRPPMERLDLAAGAQFA